ncbi:uncharacterized protein Z518_04905 [Rhinocladiella mackenziei CBS 650.93]|uniref:NACHT-NTPase and P-loop NTPases N-terminal domain-containing protein n=1 Tax=Rhinocladiella mackenziei CBS 650.93 TaxID=1442369 RepID=A0A0D2IMF1_9EURO|nr:uncharacterized protein Z518_04905 [Rhinocladiella mackenziei CBS 650.93]KIX06929.1 hypothetical protein Z518_04905 [Rhinocladiella mackenziei CBS 650.93]
MAEAAALIGLVAAIAQFAEYGMKLSERLEDFSSSVNDRPSAFTAIKVRLPAVLGILKRINKQIDNHLLGISEAEMLFPVIANTVGQVKSLLIIIEKSAPPKKGALVTRYIKAMRSLSLDTEVQRIGDRLQDNLQIISLFQTTGLVESTQQPTQQLPSPSPDGVANSHDVVTLSQIAAIAGDQAETTSIKTSDGSSTSISGTDKLDIKLSVSSLQPTCESRTAPSDSDHPESSPHKTGHGGKSSKDFALTAPSADRCSSSCSCVCHRPYQLSTPSFLSQLIGHLSVNYAGQAFVKVPCNERNCRKRKESAARMTYRFPNWAWDRVVHMALSSTALNTKVNLNTMRVLPDSAEVFSVISKGDINKLRDMFKFGQSSIYDVSRSSWTLVHTAFTLGRREMCEFLISEGADLTIDAANGSNVIERAWIHAQKSAKTPGDYVMCDNEILREVDLDDFVSSQQYNLIQKIVLGISKLKLSDVLESSTSDIDGTDIRGATALWWSAAQGNIPALRMLLENGASHAIGAAMSQTPLHMARNAEVVRSLLQHQAQVDARDTAGRTPLHCFCYRQVGASAGIVREILKGGADVNAVASGGQTPLHYATMFDNAILIPPLLEFGADINALKDENVTPLMAGIRYDKSRAVKCLLENNADPTIENQYRQNILHVAAIYAGPECMKILASSDLGRLDPGARDFKGCTPSEYFGVRKFVFDDLEQAFRNLIGAAGSVTGDESDREDDDIDKRKADAGADCQRFVMPGSFSAS